MLLVKIALVGIAIITLMIVAQDQNWAQRAGVTATCYAVRAPASDSTGTWYACKQGLLTSFPSLESDGCQNVEIVNHREVWQCNRPLVSLPSF